MTEFPTIRLAGQDYPVKPLVVKQLRIVVPAMIRLRKARFDSITEDADRRPRRRSPTRPFAPCQAGLTRDAFTDLPISPHGADASSIPVIATQAGHGSTEGTKPGEAPAGTSPTGT